MGTNSRAKEFRKRGNRQAVAQAEKNAKDLEGTQKLVLTTTYRLFALEKKLKAMESALRITDYRSQALQKIAQNNGVTETQVTDMILDLQTRDFDRASAEDDKKRNLTVIDENAAETGNVAITNIRIFKGEEELRDEQILRSKVTIGKNEVLGKAMDDALVGMRVGDSKRFAVALGNVADAAEVTLLGLRAAPAEAITAAETAAATTEDGNSDADGDS